MTDENAFRLTLIIIYAFFTIVRIYYRRQDFGRKSEKEYSQKTKAIFVLIISILGYFLTLGLWIIFPQSILLFQLVLPPLVRWLGAIVAIFATVLTFWIHHTLGKQYSAKWEIQKDHQLIMIGPYRKIRHPMYTSLNLFSISISVITSNLLIIAFSIGIAIPFYWIARTEEALLLEQFGNDYQEYMKETGRFFPPIRKK